MGVALEFAYELLAQAYDGRLQTLVIFTDGNPSDDISIGLSWFNATPRIIRYVVGVGSVHVSVLNALAGSPSRAVKVSSFSALVKQY